MFFFPGMHLKFSRWPRFDTIGFRAAVHKPMDDVTDVTSISYIQSTSQTQEFFGGPPRGHTPEAGTRFAPVKVSGSCYGDTRQCSQPRKMTPKFLQWKQPYLKTSLWALGNCDRYFPPNFPTFCGPNNSTTRLIKKNTQQVNQ